MRKTVLIFGISSFVGSNLAQILKDEYRIIGTYFKTPVEIEGITCVPCDVFKKDYVMSIVARFKPDYTIYAVGLSSLADCKLKPKLADALNTGGAVNVCTASERHQSKFVFISSGFVMGGLDVLYKEGDSPFPNSAYGNSLLATEFYIQRSSLNYLIFRCASLYGRSHNPKHPNWFECVQDAYAKGLPIQADDSVHTGFLDIYILGKVIKTAFAKKITNRLIQISSRDYMTRFEFAQIYAKTFRKDSGSIQKITGKFPLDTEKNSAAPLAIYHFNLDTTNVEEFLGTKMPSIEESLQYTFKRMHVVS